MILTQKSSTTEIKRYFNSILKLLKSDNEFPINFDEVNNLPSNTTLTAI